MSIKTREPNPNKNGEVEAPIVLIDKINAELDKIVENRHNKNKQLQLHLHPFVAAYLTSGLPSIRSSWYFKYKKWVRIVPRDAYLYLEFRFLDQNRRLLRTK
jgi:ribonuclease G